MPLRFLHAPILVLGLACLPAIWALDQAVAASDDDNGATNDDSGVPPDGDPSTVLHIPGMPPMQLPLGVHVFGPEGQPLLAPSDHGEGDPADPGPPKRLPTQSLTPEQQLKAAKAAALQRARQPQPTHAVLRAQALDE
jgi:hypothetical protein